MKIYEFKEFEIFNNFVNHEVFEDKKVKNGKIKNGKVKDKKVKNKKNQR